jgi:hypothetical protein
MSNYTCERDGQIDFFENYGIPYEDDDSVLVDNTDGVYNGNILEFKLNISNLNKVLMQAIRYLSRLRIHGESVPATILLVDLNAKKVYEYKSEDYREAIQKVYFGAPSKDTHEFVGGQPIKIYNYANMTDSNELKKVLKGKKSTIAEMYMPIDIDENCIVHWAERYYRELPKASKGDFLGDENGKATKVIGEIRSPRHFAGLINPYTGKSNEKFKYLMDCLNSRLAKKDLGAFYTPFPYAKKASELVEIAVQRAIAAGKKDYIILDRCAGTGNLEVALKGVYDANGDELISHCVVSTYEYYEYKVLTERIGDFVREVIPPTEADVVFENGNVSNADALSEDFLNNPIIKPYLTNSDCAIILFENPPYRDQSEKNNKEETKAEAHTDKSYVRDVMQSTKQYDKAVLNDSLNLFVFSAYKYYLRQETDSYILFAPIKYWKRYELSNRKVIDGFVFNRKYFHASEEAISCIGFENIYAEDDSIVLHAYDIEQGSTVFVEDVCIKKSKNTMSKLFDKRKFPADDFKSAILCKRDGTESFDKLGKKGCLKPYYNTNILAYLRVEAYGFNPNSKCLTRNGLYNGHGFYLRQDNYIEGLPLFCAKEFPFDKWYLKNMLDTTSDGGDAYKKDKDFLKSCFIYTCLSSQNKCLTFDGSDGRHYQNELCFDEGTIASRDLSTMQLDEDEQELVNIWNKILVEAKQTNNYNPKWTYGVYQIERDLNTYQEHGKGKKKVREYDYIVLNGYLIELKKKLKKYYKTHISAKMLQYELVK